jgi:hypothetical protein
LILEKLGAKKHVPNWLKELETVGKTSIFFSLKVYGNVLI